MSTGKAHRVSKEQLTENEIKLFERALEKSGHSDCIVYKGVPGRCGSAYFKCDDGTIVSPKRLAYAIQFGECKEGFALYHNGECNNYRCVNPLHYKMVDQKYGYNPHDSAGEKDDENDDENNDKFEYESLAAPNVKDYIKSQHDELDEKIEAATAGCESPIEELLAIAISKWSNPAEEKVEKQKEFTFGDMTYRADFCITSTYMEPYSRLYIHRTVVVECDGFSYHYETQEQVERDHERDREFMAAGITVVRFTGSEINKDPDGCACNALYILRKKMREALNTTGNCIEAYKEDTDEVHD